MMHSGFGHPLPFFHGAKVSIRTYHGTYIGADKHNKLYTIGHCQAWEHFTVEHVNGKVALKTAHGQYVGFSADGNAYAIGHCQAWEQMVFEPLGGNSYAIRTHHGQYVGADKPPATRVYTIGHRKEWETFQINVVGGSSPQITPSVGIGYQVPTVSVSVNKAPLPFYHGARVAIKTHHGTFIGADKNNKLYSIGHCQAWEHFTIEHVNGKVALRTAHGQYVGVGKGGDVYTIGHCKEWEQFDVVPGAFDTYSLRSYHGTYLGADKPPSNRIYAIGHCKEWERFIIKDPSNFASTPAVQSPPMGMGMSSALPFYNGAKVSIRTYHGTYIGADKNNKLYTIGHCKEWEHFLVQHVNGKVGLKTAHGQYVGVGQQSEVYCIGHCQAWEQFTFVPLGGDRYAIKTHHGTYLGADKPPSNRVYAIGHCKEWEHFTVSLVNQSMGMSSSVTMSQPSYSIGLDQSPGMGMGGSIVINVPPTPTVVYGGPGYQVPTGGMGTSNISYGYDPMGTPSINVNIVPPITGYIPGGPMPSSGMDMSMSMGMGMLPWQSVQYKKIPGALVQLSSKGSNNVWGVNQNQDIFRWDNYNSSWQNIQGKAVCVAAGVDGSAWCVNAQDQVYVHNGMSWDMVQGSLMQIDAYDKYNAIGVNRQQQIWEWKNNSWNQLPGQAVHASIGANGEKWCVNSAGEVFRYNGMSWVKQPGRLSMIHVSDSSRIVGANHEGKLFRWNATNWVELGGLGKHVAVNDNSLWVVNHSGEIFTTPH